MFDRFFGTCVTLASKALPQGRFAKALAYALNRKDGMMNLFLDGRITLDNNYAECEGIKDLVMGRKNWLFYYSELLPWSEQIPGEIKMKK